MPGWTPWWLGSQGILIKVTDLKRLKITFKVTLTLKSYVKF